MKTPPLRKIECDNEGDAGKRGIIGRRAGKARIFIRSGEIGEITGGRAMGGADFCSFLMVSKTLTICLRDPGVMEALNIDSREGPGRAKP